jgi:hypothetical protein
MRRLISSMGIRRYYTLASNCFEKASSAFWARRSGKGGWKWMLAKEMLKSFQGPLVGQGTIVT